jgi:uncharacterized membrane protein
MTRAARWIWSHGVVSTFMTGFLVLLPILITIAIMMWVGQKIVDMLGPDSLVGRSLQSLGLQILGPEARQWLGVLLGWGVVLAVIWLVGLLVKTLARHQVQTRVNDMMGRIPVVSSIYRPVSQVVNMLQQEDQSEMRSMSVVYCSFGQASGGGFLALLASSQRFHFAGQQCFACYIPTSPVPMSGGIVFVPVDKVTDIDMSVEDLMQIYFSLGVMAPKVVPAAYQPPQPAA